MIQNIQRERLIDTLLNTLEVERYVRGALLREVLDELDAAERLAPAAALARRMLTGLQSGRLGEADFTGKLAELRQLVGDSSARAA